MKYHIINVKLMTPETVRLCLETDSDNGIVICELIIPKEQYEKHKLNIGSYVGLQIL